MARPCVFSETPCRRSRLFAGGPRAREGGVIHSGNDRPDGRSSLPAGVSTSFPARFTLLLSLVETQVHAAWLLLLIAGCELTGDFTPFLRGQGVDVVADEEARGVMNTVFTLNSHVGTHIDAPRHFIGEGTAVDEVALGGLVMREAVVLDLSHGSPARTPWTRSRSSLRSVGSRPIASCARSSSSPSGSSRRSAIADRARPGSCPISRRAGPILPSVSVCSARGARSTASRRCSA